MRIDGLNANSDHAVGGLDCVQQKMELSGFLSEIFLKLISAGLCNGALWRKGMIVWSHGD